MGKLKLYDINIPREPSLRSVRLLFEPIPLNSVFFCVLKLNHISVAMNDVLELERGSRTVDKIGY
jgi:hypothetical protein